jgi:hypothetical protein
MRGAVIGVAILALCAAGGFELRNSTGRADEATIQETQAKLDAIPNAVGDWKGETLPNDPRQLERTGAFAVTSRAYRNPKTNEVFSVVVLAGPATEIGAHDPNRCYAGSGYRPVGSPAKKELAEATPKGKSGYWSARFDTDTFPAVSLQVNWAWTLDGVWVASDDARYEFVRQPVLYKVYVSRRLNALATNPTAADPTEEFLAAFFPAVQENLGPK